MLLLRACRRGHSGQGMCLCCCWEPAARAVPFSRSCWEPALQLSVPIMHMAAAPFSDAGHAPKRQCTAPSTKGAG